MQAGQTKGCNEADSQRSWPTLGEAAAEAASRESPRAGVWCGVKTPCVSSREPPGEAASARGLHRSSVGGDPTCQHHSKPCSLRHSLPHQHASLPSRRQVIVHVQGCGSASRADNDLCNSCLARYAEE